MANGVRYHARDLVVANRSLPLGEKIILCSKRRCVEVKVSDRGPFVKGRQFDVSPALARDLGMKPDGVFSVTYRRLK